MPSPAELAVALLGHDHWPVARAILDAVFRPQSRVAVKSCHASSKTFTSADAVILALLAGGDVLTTAPTWEQVRTVLWGTIRRAVQDARIDLSSWVVNQTEIITPSGAKAMGLSTNEGVRFQGWHARPDSFLLIVFDEAPGVQPDIYEAVEGISAGGDVRRLLIGNPVLASGPFFDIFASDVPGWSRVTIDAFDTPNLAGLTLDGLLALPEEQLDDNQRPYLVTRRWVRDRYYEWGEDHPLWQSRVRGFFPLQSDDALLSLAWLEAAARKPAAYSPGLPVQAGIDVAGPGDDETVLCVRQGDAILEMRAWSLADSRGAVVAALEPWRERGLDAVNVDVVGMGHYFALALDDADLPVVRVNVGEAPAGRTPVDVEKAKKKYLNLRAQVFWTFREWAEGGMLAGLTDQTALAQLAGMRYEHDSRGRIKIESKDDARKRGVKSPDRAEAIVLAFWQAPRKAFGAALAATQTGARPTLRDRMIQRKRDKQMAERGPRWA
jgi:phage terminase large subunit